MNARSRLERPQGNAILRFTSSLQIMTRTALAAFGLVGARMVMGQGMSDHFVTTWKTDNPGTSNSTSITIPTHPNETYNYDVDWNNDGVFDQLGITGDVTHDFGSAGTYTIRILGVFPRIYFNNSGDRRKILDVERWGSTVWSSMQNAFYGCTRLDVSAPDTPDLNWVLSCEGMFRSCSQLVGSAAFNYWNVGNVTNMASMFRGTQHFDQNIGSWNVSAVTNMETMFGQADSFNQPIGAWDVGNVTHMWFMFDEAWSFNQPIGAWDVSNVTNMSAMFRRAYAFDQPIGSWDVSNVMEMSYMFHYASAFNQPIGSWDVSGVSDMGSMFSSAESFDRSLEHWDISSLLGAGGMLNFSGLSIVSYDSTLIGWARLDPGETQIPQDLSLGALGLTYCHGFAARDSLMLVHGWTITDDGPDPNCTIDLCPEDINGDGLVKYAGAANDRDLILQFIGGTIPTNVVPCSGCPEDVNGDGVVKYSGADNDRDLLLQRIGGTVPTSVYVCP